MTFTKLVPNIFYTDINSGIKLFVDCLEFNIGHDELNADTPFCVVEKKWITSKSFSEPGVCKKRQSRIQACDRQY